MFGSQANICPSISELPGNENIFEVKDNDRYNLLEKTIIFNLVDAVLLLARGWKLDLNDHTMFDSMPLHLACYCGRENVVEELIKLGATIHQKGAITVNKAAGPRREMPRNFLSSREAVARSSMYERSELPIFFAVVTNKLSVVMMLVVESKRSWIKPYYGALVYDAIRYEAMDCLDFLLQV